MLRRSVTLGFTAIELLITIAIVALLATLAAPSFTVMVAGAQIRTASQGMLEGIQLARVEAIRRNERVIFAKGSQSAWTVSVESTGQVVQTRPLADGSSSILVTVTPTTATKLTFDGLGRIKPNTDASNSMTQLDIDAPASMTASSGSRALRISISSAGAARLCDPRATAGVGMGC